MIANGNVDQPFDRTGFKAGDCAAARMTGKPRKAIFQNTVHALREAAAAKADMIEIDVAVTKDGKPVLFGDDDLGCRTNGKGPVREATLAEIMALDAGHGYTSDGGESHPFRGKAVRGIQPLSTWLLYVRSSKKVMFNFKSRKRKTSNLIKLLGLAAINF